MKNPIESLNQIVNFGKHSGKSVKWIVENDPSYILWIADETDIEINQEIVYMAQANFDDMCFGEY